MIRDKSVYSTIDRKRDGLRILATRIRGRGLSSKKYDIWMANLGPSEDLKNAVQKGDMGWSEFKQRYRAELFESAPIYRRNPNIKNHGQKFTLRLLQRLAKNGAVTIMCHREEDQEHCHRHILAEILRHKVG